MNLKSVGELITKTIKGLSENPNDNSKIEEEVRNEVIALTSSFPIYKNLYQDDLSICKKGETSVVGLRPTEDGTAIRRRRLCVVVSDLLPLREFSIEIMVVKKMEENQLLIEINYLNQFI